MVYRMLLGAALSGLLAACAHLNQEFDCPLDKGVQCQSVSTLHHTLQAKEAPNASTPTSLVIWLAPYTDEKGYVHPAHTIATE